MCEICGTKRVTAHVTRWTADGARVQHLCFDCADGAPPPPAPLGLMMQDHAPGPHPPWLQHWLRGPIRWDRLGGEQS